MRMVLAIGLAVACLSFGSAQAAPQPARPHAERSVRLRAAPPVLRRRAPPVRRRVLSCSQLADLRRLTGKAHRNFRRACRLERLERARRR